MKREYGAIDFLINNAGVGAFIPLVEQTTQDIERQTRTNLEGLIKATRAFLPSARKGIINIGSAAGKTAYQEMSTYCGSKFGIRGFTRHRMLLAGKIQNKSRHVFRGISKEQSLPQDIPDVHSYCADGMESMHDAPSHTS